MTGFDKFCGFFAFLVGLVFIVGGVIGLFAGIDLTFHASPVLGAIPAFVGWGIVRGLYWGWSPQVEIRYIDPKTGEEYQFEEPVAQEPAAGNLATAVLTFLAVLAAGMLVLFVLMGK